MLIVTMLFDRRCKMTKGEKLHLQGATRPYFQRLKRDNAAILNISLYDESDQNVYLPLHSQSVHILVIIYI